MQELPFAAPASLVRTPLRTVGNRVLDILCSKHVCREETCSLQWRDVDAHTVVQIRLVTTLLRDECLPRLGCARAAVTGGPLVERLLAGELLESGRGEAFNDHPLEPRIERPELFEFLFEL